MKLQLKTSVALLAFSLSACGYTTDFRNSNTNFGFATTQNALVQTGSGLSELNSRFNQDGHTIVNFEFNRAELDGTARAILDRQANFINGFPMIKFRVYGHTDQVGSEGYNNGLGLRRAQAVVSYLASRGVSRSRVEAVVSEGETMPLVDSGGRERLNRRAETQVVGFAAGFDGSEFDGKRAVVLYNEYVSGITAVEQASIAASVAAR